MGKKTKIKPGAEPEAPEQTKKVQPAALVGAIISSHTTASTLAMEKFPTGPEGEDDDLGDGEDYDMFEDNDGKKKKKIVDEAGAGFQKQNPLLVEETEFGFGVQ